MKTSESECDEKQAFQAQFASGRFVPFVRCVRAAAFAAATQRNCVDAERKRNVGIGGTAFESRTIAEEAVHVANGFEQRRIIGELSGGARAERANI